MLHKILDRNDRFGSNILFIIAQLEICRVNNYDYFAERELLKKYKDTAFYNFITKNIQMHTHNEYIDLFDEFGNEGNHKYKLINILHKLSINSEKSFRSIFCELYRNEIINILNMKFGHDPWNSQNVCSIHIRGGDILRNPKYIKSSKFAETNSSKAFQYVNECVKNKCKLNVKQHEDIFKYDKQIEIHESVLQNCINDVKSKFNNIEFVIITEPGNESNINFSYPIYANKDFEKDLWLMAHSRIVICSQSTFGILGCLLNIYQDCIYMPEWGISASIGYNENNCNLYSARISTRE